ncbi:MAG TPA: ribonuclease HI family protein [Patescibacteria group bacterium]|jgi:ribonuclease HI|nr:ribonuclease HI family protein [Patescibacteria group bacterium]
MAKLLVINTDGGARGNPGPAGIGLVIKSETGELLYSHGAYIGDTTNNVAEYSALIKALEESVNLGGTSLRIQMDSELIVKQMTGVYKIKEPTLQGLAAKALVLLKKFQGHTFVHVRREFNKEADALVNQALDAHQA